MGQKVHPYGFRLGYTKPWKSRWFVERDYAKLLLEDYKLKQELKEKLKSAGEALALLQFTPNAAARLIEKVLRSAIANAEHNHQVRDLDDLRVVKATADGGPSMKRVSPRAMGRAFFIKHRTSHLTIELSNETARPSRAAQR